MPSQRWRKEYTVNDNVNLCTLDQQWSTAKQLQGETVSSFIDRVCLLATRMESAGYNAMEKKVIGAKIINGLRDELAPARQQLIMQPTAVADLGKLRLSLMAAESTLPKEQSTYYGSQGSSSSSGGGGGGGKKKGKGKGVRCFNCGEHGHFAKDCKKPPRDKSTEHAPPKPKEPVLSFYSEEQGEQSHEQPEVALLARLLEKTQKEELKAKLLSVGHIDPTVGPGKTLQAFYLQECATEFVVDSGAPRHIIQDVSLLHNASKPDITTMGWGDGSSEVVAQGQVHVQLFTGDSWVPVVLTGAVCVPGVARNLLSLPRITAVGGSGVFEQVSCVLKAPGGSVLGVGKMSPSRHYVIQCKVQVPEPTSCFVADAQLVHRRMGHLGWDVCTKLPELVEGVSVTAAEFRKAAADDCEVCLQSKLVRASFDPVERSTVYPWSGCTVICWMPMPSCLVWWATGMS
jgi:hypothetical protein